MFDRTGPALAPLLCAGLVGILALIAGFVPIGRPARTVDTADMVGMLVGAGMLALWALGLLFSAWRVTGEEARGVLLVPPMSPGVFDFLFTAPLLVLVPVASLGTFGILRGVRPSLLGVVAVALCVGLVAIREFDRAASVQGGRVVARTGWLWVRREAVPVAAVRGVVVRQDIYRGAPSYAVKLDLGDDGAHPALAAVERRFRQTNEAEAEAARWRGALARLLGPP